MTKGGGGTTRFKEHLAQRGKDVRECPSVPLEVKTFFNRELDKVKAKKAARERERLRQQASAARGNVIDVDEDAGVDSDLQAAMEQSRMEYEFRERAGSRYERGAGSGSGGGGGSSVGQGPLPRMFSRSRSHVPERVRDYNLATSSGPRQQRIDTGPWTSKGRSSKEILGRAWAKACHAVGIPGRKVDDPYFRAAIGRKVDDPYFRAAIIET